MVTSSKVKVVLIVEDEDLEARLYKKVLEEDQIVAEVARDGEEALKLLREGEAPNLVILDIMMPRLNGMKVLEEMQVDTRLREIPVVILSNLSGDLDKKLGKDKGAIDYWVKKDLPPQEMLSRVRKLLGLAK